MRAEEGPQRPEAIQEVNAPLAQQGPARRDLLAMGAAALICVAAYFAIASENREPYRSRPVTYDYYDLLAASFLSGHLDINLPPDPEPGRDPMRYTPRVHDVSMYHGKYYLYFGAVPAVVLFVPWRLVTGSDLPQYWAGAVFAGMGYLFTLALLGRLRRDCLPWLSDRLLFASALILGLITWWPLLLSRVGVWETCISSAYCFSCLALLCLYNGMRDGLRCGWLASASLCVGLAIASRPNYFFGAAILIVPLLHAWRTQRTGSTGAGAWARRICATFLPIAGVGALIALYDYQRFGDPLELGTGHMILFRPNPTHPFSLGYAGYNIFTYYLAPAHHSPWFPFFNPSPLPPIPKDYVLDPEDMYGVLANMPILLAAAFSPFLPGLWGRASRLGAAAGAAALLLLAVGGPLLFYAGANNRYIPDANCGLPLLAILGIWAIAARTRGGGMRRKAAVAALGLLAAFSAVFAFCAGIQRDEIFRRVHPGAYRALAHALDYPAEWYDRVRGVKYGPLTLSARFPGGKGGLKNEPLVVTGWAALSNVLFARYTDPTHMQFGFVGASGVALSKAFEIDYAATHSLTISMGSLYPPRESPFFDSLSATDAALISGTLFVTVDGTTRLRVATSFFDAVARRPELGRGPISVLDQRWVFTGDLAERQGPL